MPYVDVTTAPVAGLNAASDIAAGFVQGHSGAVQAQERQQARLDDAEYRRQLISARNRELEALARERDRDAGFQERRLKIAEDQDRGVDEASDFVARMTEKTLGATAVDEFEEQLRAQRAETIKFSKGLGPRGRAVAMAGMDDDERDERAAFGQRAALAAWERVLTHPLLAGDESPVSEETKALAMENIEALKTGQEKPAKSMRDLEDLRAKFDEERTKQRNWQSGLAWANQQEADGVGDIEAMNRARVIFENEGPGADLKKFKRDFLRAKYNVEMDTVKLGKIEIPRSIKVGTPEWREIAESAADQEVTELLDKDPWLAKHVEDMELDDYLKIREKHRQSVMRKYASLSGASRTQIQQMGLGEDPKAVEKNARADIEKRLRAAGIDPNQPIRAPNAKQSTRSDVNRRTPITPQQPESGLGLKPPQPGMQAPNEPVQPGRQRVSSKGVNDGDTYDESDLEEIYNDSEPDNDSDD